MARLVTKFKYLKPDQEKPIGGYATYIATREGVAKMRSSLAKDIFEQDLLCIYDVECQIK